MNILCSSFYVGGRHSDFKLGEEMLNASAQHNLISHFSCIFGGRDVFILSSQQFVVLAQFLKSTTYI